MGPIWYRGVVVGWQALLGGMLTLDFVLMILKNQRIPTLSKVIVSTLPWWIAIPASILLTVHLSRMYLGK